MSSLQLAEVQAGRGERLMAGAKADGHRESGRYISECPLSVSANGLEPTLTNGIVQTPRPSSVVNESLVMQISNNDFFLAETRKALPV